MSKELKQALRKHQALFLAMTLVMRFGCFVIAAIDGIAGAVTWGVVAFGLRTWGLRDIDHIFREHR